jgi:threonylcarbamoyladenosine tRNA methylthiotransferase MtaB
MKSFWIQTLGCKVNHYESEQFAADLRRRGYRPAQDAASADVRLLNTCSVTAEAASKSRSAARRLGKLSSASADLASCADKPTVIVAGCWATSDPDDARAIGGVDAVIGHHQDAAAEMDRIFGPEISTASDFAGPTPRTGRNSSDHPLKTDRPGTHSLPLLDEHQSGRQRGVLKVQDGCDAHCTYCIIPTLRQSLWSKPIDRAVAEAQRLVDSGHLELVLTGIFLGAYGQPTALRRNQPPIAQGHLAELIDALCTRVTGLLRLRLSSLEPGDLTADLLATLVRHRAVVPHFHLPLQSGSDSVLRRMNRQYRRDDFLEMVARVRVAFDRPALTSDVVVGFPGETDADFHQTMDVVAAGGFIHVHAFPYSPRRGTAATRLRGRPHGNVVQQRLSELRHVAEAQSIAYRQSFIGQELAVLVEEPAKNAVATDQIRHGRCDRYFDVFFEGEARPGDLARVRIDRIRGSRTLGTLIEIERPRTFPLALYPGRGQG